jgi:hypothetical protein
VERVDLLKELVQGEPAFPQLGHKATKGHEASHEPLNMLDVPDLAYFSDGRNLVGVCFEAALGNDVPQELTPGDPEVALLQVQLNVEGFLQVDDEAAALLGCHNDVISIDLQVAPYLPLEAELHTLLICGPYVL